MTRRRRVLFVLLALALVSLVCVLAVSLVGKRADEVFQAEKPSSSEILGEGTESAPRAQDESVAHLVKVFYATDRRGSAAHRRADGVLVTSFSSDAADRLSFGTVFVNVPPYEHRKLGEIPTPPLWRVNRWWFDPDTARDMFVAAVEPLDSLAFLVQLGQEVHDTDEHSILIFVHGYNVTFEDAAMRTAQIATDVGFPGVPVMYSWPSQGEMAGYLKDVANADNSADLFAGFLRSVVNETGATRVLVVGHSMGSHVIGGAVRSLQERGQQVHLSQVLLAAPDLDRRYFERHVLPQLREAHTRVTVYASAQDRALQASRRLNGVWRLGLGGDSLVVLPGMDTIDATDVRTDLIGHSDFGSVQFLDDLVSLLRNDLPPDKRNLRAHQKHGLTYWRFAKAQG